MTAIWRFPEEVLHIIFNSLTRYDVLQCQKVCRSWYKPAHVIWLKDIVLESATDFELFANSINHNPDAYYLNAIQKITICIPYSLVHVDINDVSKGLFDLIVRFPCLKSIIIHGDNDEDPPLQFKYVDQDAIVKSCPKLERVDIQAKIDNVDTYLDFLYKLRYTLTFMRLNQTAQSQVEYLTYISFLGPIHEPIVVFYQFKELLKHIENSSALKDIAIVHEHDKENFAEQYLLEKSKDERDLLVERLSKVTALESHQEESPFCANVTAFIIRYMTGLKSLTLTSASNSNWTNREYIAFNSLLEYACTLDAFSVSLKGLNIVGLSRCIKPAVLMMESFETNKLKRTHLELDISDTEEVDDFKVCMTQDSNSIKLRVQLICVSIKPQQIIDLFKSISSLNHIQKFTVGASICDLDGNILVYDQALGAISRRLVSLKEVVLDIPTLLGYRFKFNQSVTNLVLRSPVIDRGIFGGEFDITRKMLQNCLSAFPNLEYLQLFYFSGVWQQHLYEFQINLGYYYSLQKLTVDLTPAKYQMRYSCKKGAFIVIEVKSFSNSKRWLFKTPTNLLGVTEINDASLEGLTRGKDYIVVHIATNNLGCIDIFTCRQESSLRRDYYYERRDTDDLRYVNLFDNKDLQ